MWDYTDVISCLTFSSQLQKQDSSQRAREQVSHLLINMACTRIQTHTHRHTLGWQIGSQSTDLRVTRHLQTSCLKSNFKKNYITFCFLSQCVHILRLSILSFYIYFVAFVSVYVCVCAHAGGSVSERIRSAYAASQVSRIPHFPLSLSLSLSPSQTLQQILVSFLFCSLSL